MSEPKSSNRSFANVLKDESLEMFLDAMREFDRAFVDAIAAGSDFTLKLEVHGNCGKMLHARCSADTFRRPGGKQEK